MALCPVRDGNPCSVLEVCAKTQDSRLERPGKVAFVVSGLHSISIEAPSNGAVAVWLPWPSLAAPALSGNHKSIGGAHLRKMLFDERRPADHRDIAKTTERENDRMKRRQNARTRERENESAKGLKSGGLAKPF